jgi:hypothetical protein
VQHSSNESGRLHSPTPFPTPEPRPSRPTPKHHTIVLSRRTCNAAIALVAAALATSPAARADGDPASDILLSQNLYLPADAATNPRLSATLETAVTAANAAGYRIRIALIASPTDLGAIPSLWKKPQTYASFLGAELREVYDGRLLIVMPNGLGIFAASGASPSEEQVVAATAVPSGSDGLLLASLAALKKLAPTNPTRTTTSHTTPIAVAVAIAAGTGLCALLIVLKRRRRARTSAD